MDNIDLPSKETHIILGLPSNLPENVAKKEVKSYRGKLILGGIIFALIIIPMLSFLFLPKSVIQASKEIILAPFTIESSGERYTRWRASNAGNPVAVAITAETQQKLTDAQVLALADNKYSDGTVPLGDKKYVTDKPETGYVFLCNSRSGPSGGAQVNGPWISGSTWNYKKKTAVRGTVAWPEAFFSNTVSGETRYLSGNALPLHHTTGTFPIASTDPAYTYDRNPNSIRAQNLSEQVSSYPFYSDNPYCVEGEVGVMLSGVPLFNAFDATLRDAPAHEVQDACGGHPQNSGKYHYHNLSSCFKDISVKTVLGYALDGFPITGPQVAADKYLTTEDLDECHGITSDISVNGKTVTTYHYVMTQDFPYSVSCFRSVPAGVSGQQGSPTQNEPSQPKQETAQQEPDLWIPLPQQHQEQQVEQPQQQPPPQNYSQQPAPAPEPEAKPGETIWDVIFPQAATTTTTTTTTTTDETGTQTQTEVTYESEELDPESGGYMNEETGKYVPIGAAVLACWDSKFNAKCSYKFQGKNYNGSCKVDKYNNYYCMTR